jgi:hypothetical protein
VGGGCGFIDGSKRRRRRERWRRRGEALMEEVDDVVSSAEGWVEIMSEREEEGAMKMRKRREWDRWRRRWGERVQNQRINERVRGKGAVLIDKPAKKWNEPESKNLDLINI